MYTETWGETFAGAVVDAEPSKLNSSDLERRMERQSKLSGEFVVLLCVSTVLAALGLFQNSAAVIIGAMIIAPLMRPLAGLSLGIVTGDLLLLRRSLVTITLGTIVAVGIAYIVATVLQQLQPTAEMLARTKPTLIDLGVAVFAGALGAYSQAKERANESLAGVAIAVALVPPLAVVGTGLAINAHHMWCGALLLYATNLAGISLSGAIVFLVFGCAPIRQARRGLLVSLALLAALIVPLALSMNDLILENRLSRRISSLLLERTYTFKDTTLKQIEVTKQGGGLLVSATVVGFSDSITSNQVGLVEQFLSRELHEPVTLRLKMLNLHEVTANSVTDNARD